MDELTRTFEQHHREVFQRHGMTARGVDWNDENELIVRYDKMLDVLHKDFMAPQSAVTLLDVGCGWGGLLRRIQSRNLAVDYSGIDVVAEMIEAARQTFPGRSFLHGDFFALNGEESYDFVVCNAILTQKLGFTIPAMEQHARQLIRKMFALCRHGIAFNMMSTRVNFMVGNLYYQNPVELLNWLLIDLSPRVRLDHGYSSLGSGKGRYYDFTVYAYKD